MFYWYFHQFIVEFLQMLTGAQLVMTGRGMWDGDEIQTTPMVPKSNRIGSQIFGKSFTHAMSSLLIGLGLRTIKFK